MSKVSFGRINPRATPWKGNEKVPCQDGEVKYEVYLKDLNQEEVKDYAEQVKQQILIAFNTPIKR